MQAIISAIGHEAWQFAKLLGRPPFWYPAALAQAHGAPQDVTLAERLLLARFISRLPASMDRDRLCQAFLAAFSFGEIKIEDAICLMEFQFICNSLLRIHMFLVLWKQDYLSGLASRYCVCAVCSSRARAY